MRANPRHLIDGLFAAALAAAWLLQTMTKDESALLAACIVYGSTMGIDYSTRASNSRLLISRVLPVALLFTSTSVESSLVNASFWFACCGAYLMGGAALYTHFIAGGKKDSGIERES